VREVTRGNCSKNDGWRALFEARIVQALPGLARATVRKWRILGTVADPLECLTLPLPVQKWHPTSALPTRISTKPAWSAMPKAAERRARPRCIRFMPAFKRLAARRRWWLKGPGRTFSIVDPAGTWAWRSGPADAAAVRQGAVLALLPAEAAVQLRAEAAVAELPRRAEAAAVELAPCAEAAVQLHAEAAVAELSRRAGAAAVELAPCAEAAYQRHRYPRWPATVRQEACDRREASRCWPQGRLLRP